MKAILGRTLTSLVAVPALLALSALPTLADTAYLVTIDTSSVNGTSGFVDFQFNPGNGTSQAATATVLNYSQTGGGLSGSPSITGNVVGTLPSPVTFTNSTALNEYFHGTTFGTKITFLLVLGGAAVNSPNGLANAGSTFGVGLYDSGQNPILTNQGALSGFAAQFDINLNGQPTYTTFPNANAGPSVVTVSPVSRSQCLIANYQLVSSVTGPRNQVNLTYKADYVNIGGPKQSVIATAASLDPFTLRIAPGAGSLNFGPPVPVNSEITSNNTFTIIVDNTVPLDFAKLQWTCQDTAALPVADPGMDRTVAVGTNVMLDGSLSNNPSDVGTLTYSWMFTSRPVGTSTRLFFTTSVNPTFVADVPGKYVITLTVSNGVASASKSVTITAQ